VTDTFRRESPTTTIFGSLLQVVVVNLKTFVLCRLSLLILKVVFLFMRQILPRNVKKNFKETSNTLTPNHNSDF